MTRQKQIVNLKIEKSFVIEENVTPDEKRTNLVMFSTYYPFNGYLVLHNTMFHKYVTGEFYEMN